NDNGDLLSMLMSARDEDGSRMTDRQLRDEVMTFLLAGHETTALSLSWAWFLLSENPEAENKLHHELARVLDGKNPSFEDLPRFAYFPFGGGPRYCVGASFAMMEATLLLAAIAQRFRLRMVPGHKVVPVPSITLRPKYGIKMSLHQIRV